MKREWFGPVVVVALGVGFAALCVLVWLSRGNARLVQRKLRLGGLLLAWTGAMTGTGCDNASCYETTGGGGTYPLLELTQDDGTGTVTLEAGAPFALEGVVGNLGSSELSFALLSQVDSDLVLAQGDITAEDGAFDSAEETFSFELPADTATGSYYLVFYGVSADKQADNMQLPEVFKVVIESATP